jgi:pyruvate/2-oxoglutarate dehydrogenase complex dihydrolipoamide dehydrogenase (E3) component
MISIIDWRMTQCISLGVKFQFDVLVGADEVVAEDPDVVIVATGGCARTDLLKSGNEHVVSSWDIISGHVKPAPIVLLFDDVGDHAALQAAEFIAATGSQLEIMTPDRTFAPEVMAMNLVPYMRSLQRHNVTFTVTYRVEAVRRENDRLLATIGSDYCGTQMERVVDQVVVNCGTIPMDDLYFALRPLSRNFGAVDHQQLVTGRPQTVSTNPHGSFQLYRVGDAVSARNTHAAIYDSLRLVKDL